MGEATPAQSAAGPFGPMLGVGLGSLPGGVGARSVVAPPRGSAVPQLHNAIVERLRARIELCRRHHSTCENRYQRSQAETSDREHENTLHLLNIVHQGPGNRKAKGSRGSNQQPPEYNRANGERKGSEGEPKISTRVAGSLRRKIEGHALGGGHKQNGLSCGFSGSDFKRVCLDGGALGRGPCSHNPNQQHPLPSAPSGMDGQRKSYMLPHDVFNMTLRDMKKEPSEVPSCGRSGPEVMFDFKDEGGGGQIDPELQDLFDELTKTVPTLNDLELERMLKQDDTFDLDLGRPSSAGAAAGALCCPSMDRPIKMEPSPDFNQVQCGLPQLRPASAGPSFGAAASSAGGPQKAPPSAPSLAPPPRAAMPCWPEISRAEQLKQMAANQQQPGSLLHHQHPVAPPAGLTSWAPGPTPASSSSSSSNSTTTNFPPDKVSGPVPVSGQRIGSQNKGISSNCLFKTNGHVDMKVLSTKPMLHFSPKAPNHSGSQPMSVMAASAKTTSAQQQQSAAKSQPHPALQFQNQQGGATSGPSCLQAKQPPGLPFKGSQPRQGVPSGPRMPVMSGQLQLQAPGNQQKGPPAMPRPLNQPHPAMGNGEKDNNHDQFNRHLTRPPPDYKQSRGIVGVQQGSIFTGPSPVQSPPNVAANELQSMSCRSAPQLSPSPPDRRFGISHPTSCLGQFQQHSNNQNRLVGLSPTKNRFLGPNHQGNSFGMNMNSSGVSAGGLGGLIRNMGWPPANKQGMGGLRRLPAPLQSQGSRLDMPNHLYQQRHVGPPNQVAPDMGLLPHNPSTRPSQPMLGSPTAVGNLNQASPEQRVPAGSYSGASPSPSSYHNNRANHLTFDFLPEGDNTVPGINTDSDFIDSLLKSGSGNDDWMKDINLDEILGGHS